MPDGQVLLFLPRTHTPPHWSHYISLSITGFIGYYSANCNKKSQADIAHPAE